MRRGWIAAPIIVVGMVASRLAASAIVDRTTTGISSGTASFLETLVVLVIFAVATWRLVLVPVHHRNSIATAGHPDRGCNDWQRSTALDSATLGPSGPATRHLKLVPALRPTDR